MKELTGKDRRKTRLQFRGNFMDLGDEVEEGTPAAFQSFPKDAPAEPPWVREMADERENPLTARVVANRFWEQIFGTGLVRTSEEFGTQGELPTHPELLDWLAVELQTDWDVKAVPQAPACLRAYRQSAKVTPELVEKDPENRLLAGTARAAVGRDGSRPGAPCGGVAQQEDARALGEAAAAQPRRQRGLRRSDRLAAEPRRGSLSPRHLHDVAASNPYPSMSTFDAPNRDICTVRRTRTNTPLRRS